MHVLLDNLELCQEDASKLLHNVRPVVGSLQPNNNLLNNIIVDARQVYVVVGGVEVIIKVLHLDGKGAVESRGRWWGIGSDLAAFVGRGCSMGGMGVDKRMGPFCCPCGGGLSGLVGALARTARRESWGAIGGG